MRRHPARIWSVVIALIAAGWAFFLLPPQQAAWSGADSPAWLRALDAMPVYDGLRQTLPATGTSDAYLVFGAAASVSFVLLWLATGPVLAALGCSGRVLGALLLAAAPITLLSYLNHPADAPLHVLWGAELFALLAIGLWGLVVAFAAPRRRGIPIWERILVGSTLPVVVVATFALTYWPHGSLVGLGLEAAVLAGLAPRWAPALARQRPPGPPEWN
jgi:hypothetical protein